jgi:hypothetical protein
LPPQELYLPLVWALPWKKQLWSSCLQTERPIAHLNFPHLRHQMHAAAGHQLFSEASLVNQVATGSTWQCKAMVGDTVLHPGTKVAGLFVTRRLSWQCCQSSSTCSRLSPYDYSHQACAVFENWHPSHSQGTTKTCLGFFFLPKGMTPSVTVYSHSPRPVSISFWNLNLCNQGSVDNCKHK